LPVIVSDGVKQQLEGVARDLGRVDKFEPVTGRGQV
jgi:hypothetical protein